MFHLRLIRGSLFVALLLAFIGRGAADEKFPPELVRFRAYDKNPVFKAAGPGHWDVRLQGGMPCDLACGLQLKALLSMVNSTLMLFVPGANR